MVGVIFRPATGSLLAAPQSGSAPPPMVEAETKAGADTVGVVTAGVYLLCLSNGLDGFYLADFLVLICAFTFAVILGAVIKEIPCATSYNSCHLTSFLLSTTAKFFKLL